MNAFKAGDEVYTADGRLVEYVAVAADGHIVRQLPEESENDYGGPAPMGYPELVHQVLEKAPSFKFDQDFVARRDELARVSQQLREVKASLADAEKKRSTELSKIAAHPDLSIIIDWMEGRITHIATFDRYGDSPIRIMPLLKALQPNEREEREGTFRLLSLYGGYHGPNGPSSGSYRDNLHWQLGMYSDGSGNSNTACVLGTSEEDVRNRMQLFLDREFKKRDNNHFLSNWAESAVALGFSIPPAWVEKVEERAKNRRLQAQEQAQKELASAKARLAAAEAAAQSVTP